MRWTLRLEEIFETPDFDSMCGNCAPRSLQNRRNQPRSRIIKKGTLWELFWSNAPFWRFLAIFGHFGHSWAKMVKKWKIYTGGGGMKSARGKIVAALLPQASYYTIYEGHRDPVLLHGGPAREVKRRVLCIGKAVWTIFISKAFFRKLPKIQSINTNFVRKWHQNGPTMVLQCGLIGRGGKRSHAKQLKHWSIA